MRKLKAILRERLEGADRIAVLAVGSELRGDDAAGLLVAEELTVTFKPRPGGPSLQVFLAHTAPENLTGEIKQFRPTHLIILDAADMGQKPGDVGIIEETAFTGNASFSTHSLSLRVMTDYLRRFLSLEIIIVGLQPATREFGQAPSDAVRNAAKRVAKVIAAVVNQ